MSSVQQPDHVVVLVLSDLSAGQVYGNASMPFLSSLAAGGAQFTNSYSVAGSDQGNSLALMTGNSFGWWGTNIGQALSAAGLSFDVYGQNPLSHYRDSWNNSSKLGHGLAWAASFPSNFASLPTVSFVVQAEGDDGSDGALAATDSWAQQTVGGYARWALANNSLLVVTSNRR